MEVESCRDGERARRVVFVVGGDAVEAVRAGATRWHHDRRGDRRGGCARRRRSGGRRGTARSRGRRGGQRARRRRRNPRGEPPPSPCVPRAREGDGACPRACRGARGGSIPCRGRRARRRSRASLPGHRPPRDRASPSRRDPEDACRDAPEARRRRRATSRSSARTASTRTEGKDETASRRARDGRRPSPERAECSGKDENAEKCGSSAARRPRARAVRPPLKREETTEQPVIISDRTLKVPRTLYSWYLYLRLRNRGVRPARPFARAPHRRITRNRPLRPRRIPLRFLSHLPPPRRPPA